MRIRSMALFFIAGSAAAQTTTPSLIPSAPAEKCAAAPASVGSATEWLDRAAARVLPKSFDGRVFRYRATHDQPLWEQSDRTYEPFIPNMAETIRWYSPATNVEGRQPSARPVTPAQYPTTVVSTTGTFAGRDTLILPVAQLAAFGAAYMRLNPWMVLADWRSHASDVRIGERCVYRDYPRIVLTRGGERLYLSESDGVPIKLERVEPHYLFGQVKAEYLWTTWWVVRGGGSYPLSAVRLFDGFVYERVGVAQGTPQVIPTDSAPRLAVPSIAPMSEKIVIGAPATDTVRVDANTFLLVTQAYTEVVTMQRDTVYLLDATSGEERGRQDSTWIAKLFPGKPVTLVVTDLAWPHISSVRFWVARGATIVSHQTSESFIRRVTDRKWTLEPDALEKSRATARLRFKGVTDSLRLAGGAITVHAMRGNSTEGALGVSVPGAKFFWAGDYIQNSALSPYYYDVVMTVRALGLQPLKVGAQHTPLLDWPTVNARVPDTSR